LEIVVKDEPNIMATAYEDKHFAIR